MSQNFYYNKQDHSNNAQKVLQFYQQVLKEFAQRLDKEFRYKGLISTQQIQHLELIVNQRLNQPAFLFQKFLSMKEGSTRPDDFPKNELAIDLQKGKVKEQYNEADNEYKIGSDIKIKDKDSQSDDDDLVEYEAARAKQDIGVLTFKPAKSEIEIQVKKEDNPEPYKQKKPADSIKQVKQEEVESQVSEDELNIDECYNSLNSIILSTFNTSTLKHKPKEQKISLTLDNTFLKSAYNQFYVGQAQVDIQKIEKSQIRKEFPLGGGLVKRKG